MSRKTDAAKYWLLVFLLAALAGCQNAMFAPELVPDADSAVVYLYRPAATTPGLAKPKLLAYPEILVDGESVGTVGYNEYISFRVSPGKHTILVTGLTPAAKDWDFRDLKQIFIAEAGEQLFRRLRVDFNTNESRIAYGMQYYYNLTPVKPEDAIYEIRHISPH